MSRLHITLELEDLPPEAHSPLEFYVFPDHISSFNVIGICHQEALTWYQRLALRILRPRGWPVRIVAMSTKADAR